MQMLTIDSLMQYGFPVRLYRLFTIYLCQQEKIICITKLIIFHALTNVNDRDKSVTLGQICCLNNIV